LGKTTTLLMVATHRLIGLVGKAEATVINPFNVAAVSQPPNFVSKLREMRALENVVIVNYAPDIKTFPSAVADIINVIVGNISVQKRRHVSQFLWTNTGLALRHVWGFCENEIYCLSISKNFGFDSVSNSISGRFAVVQNYRLGLEFKFAMPFLINRAPDNDRQISTQLSARRFPLILAQGNQTPSDIGERGACEGRRPPLTRSAEHQAAPIAGTFFRFLRQPNKPIAPRPEAKSGRAAGIGLATMKMLPPRLEKTGKFDTP
jgi:hypothetical protein